MRKLVLGAIALGLGVASVVLAIDAPPPTYTTIDATGQPLKERFNADAGKVRIVALVAPT